MTLHKIRDFDPNYQEHFDNRDIIGADLYSNNEKIGSVDDLLVDDTGRVRYFVINTGIWIFGKKVLLPIGQGRPSFDEHRVYVDNLTRDQVERLPSYDEATATDYDYEEQVRGVYRPVEPSVEPSLPVDANAAGIATVGDTPSVGMPMTTDMSAVGTSMPADAPATSAPTVGTTPTTDRSMMVGDTADVYDRNAYNYDRDPGLYDLSDRDHQHFKLYEERLAANKTREKTGEVSIGKRVETTTATASVPIERERVVIEETGATDVDRVVDPSEATFQEGEIARMEVYEERPDIRKEAVVREEVDVRKEVTRDTVEAQDEIRRERVDVRTDGNPLIDKRPDPLPDEQI